MISDHAGDSLRSIYVRVSWIHPPTPASSPDIYLKEEGELELAEESMELTVGQDRGSRQGLGAAAIH